MKVTRYICSVIAMALVSCATVMAQVASVTVGGNVTLHDTFSSALEQANATSGAVIRLLDDTGVDNDEAVMKSNITLDLAGHMLWGTGYGLIVVDGSKANVTIEDSSDDASGYLLLESDTVSYCRGVYVRNSATLTMNGGNIVVASPTNENLGTVYGILAKTGARLYVNGGTIEARCRKYAYGININYNTVTEINNCEINCASELKYGYDILQSGGSITINGGTFTSQSYYFGTCMNVSGTGSVTIINGGKFLNSLEQNTIQSLYIYPDKDGNPRDGVSINGGLFSHEYGLEPYLNGKSLQAVPKGSEDYAAGYRVYVSDEPYTTNIARNITTGKEYATLEEALHGAVAGETVSLVNDYTLKNDVTVREGVTLLVPYNVINSCPTDSPEGVLCSTTHTEEKVYRTLTVADGVRITLLGDMSVAAIHASAPGGCTFGSGTPNGHHALVMLGEGAEIDVAGHLYCWGYVAGKGTVTVRPQGTLHETLVICDHRGGTISADIEDKTYPYIQTYVQNVEAKVVFQYGARNECNANIAYDARIYSVKGIQYVTPDTAGVYRMHSNSVITRSYDASRDRMEYTFEGNVSLGTLVVAYGGFTINSMYYTLPVNSNVSMTVRNGELTVPYDYYLEPGARITIASDAVMTINKGKTFYVYDREDWNNIYCIDGYLLPLEYTIGNGHNNRSVRWSSNTTGDDEASYAKLESAAIDVQGTLRIKGQLMTSQHGVGNVGGTGTVLFLNNAKQATSNLYQAVGITSELVEIPFSSLPVTAGVMPGDVNGDGLVSMADANMVVNAYLGTATVNVHVADMDGDGRITMADANAIVNAYMGM